MKPLSSDNTQSWLSWFFRGLLIFLLVVVVGRLIELQVIKGHYYEVMANENRVRRIPITAARGKILARGGEVLVGNKEVKRAVVFDPEQGFEKTDDLEGVPDEQVITEFTRDYPLGESFAHASGYLGEVNESELGKVNPDCPEKGPATLGAWIGRSGLEQEYNCTLSGIDGEEIVEVDSMGRRVRTLGRRDPVAGEDIRTNIDFHLQEKVAEIASGVNELEKKNPRESVGNPVAVIVTDTKGEVLSLYSYPSYDPNAFVGSDSSRISDYLEDESLPMFDRVIGGLFHPGSVYKPVTSIAALESGAIDTDYTYEDTGVLELKTAYGDFSYSNWYFTQYGGKEGEIGLTRAIARSTDTFFYKIGELAGIDELVNWSEKLGLDKTTKIDIPGEVPGLVPSPEWKERAKGEQWFLGNTYHMSIGQGDLAVTPAEINRMISAVASNRFCDLKIAGSSDCKELNIKDEYQNLIIQGMHDACSATGTGFSFFPVNTAAQAATEVEKDWPPAVACKTGTAETGLDGVSHAWFVFFSPVTMPEIVVTVMVEEGGSGAYAAGPIAREIYDYWFGYGD